MQESPLIRTLQLLTPEEFDTLIQFVESPIFNDADRFKDTVRLMEYLHAYFPDFQSADLDKKKVGKKLFPRRTNPVSEVERTMAQLMHVVKQFINFRYSAVKEGRVVRSGRKNNITQDPVALLNFARQQLALMRFYSERLLQKPVEAALQARLPVEELVVKGKKRRVKKAENYFQSLYQELESVFDEQQHFGLFEEYEFNDFYYFKYWAEQEKAIYESLHEWSAKGGIINLLVASESLDRFYMLSKLDQICKLLHLQQMAVPFSEESDEYRRLKTNQKLTIKMVKLLTKHNYDVDDPAITLYFTLLQLLSKKSPEKTDPLADQLFVLLHGHPDLVPAKRFKDINVILRSYWSRRYRQTRDRQFLEKLFQSHEDEIENLRRNQEKIQSTHFQNTLFNAIKLKHLEWAEAFLNDFSKKITSAPDPELVADIGYAMLYFAQGNFQKAEKRLPHYFNYGTTDDPNLYPLAASLDMRIRYELGSLLDQEGINMRRATHKRIKENKTIPEDRRAGILAFYDLTIRMYRLQEKLLFQTPNCKTIRQEFEDIKYSLAHNPVVDSEWLQEKCAELRELIKKKCPKTGNK